MNKAQEVLSLLEGVPEINTHIANVRKRIEDTKKKMVDATPERKEVLEDRLHDYKILLKKLEDDRVKAVHNNRIRNTVLCIREPKPQTALHQLLGDISTVKENNILLKARQNLLDMQAWGFWLE